MKSDIKTSAILLAAGKGTRYKGTKQDVIFHEIPRVLEGVVVVGAHAYLNIRIIDHVFQIDDGGVVINQINTLVIIFPHEASPLSDI